MADRSDLLQARDKALSLWERSADMWLVVDPEGVQLEWFDSRPEAESHAIEVMEEWLRYNGEARDHQCTVLAVVSSTEEVIGANRDDDSERGEWLRERGFDYEVTGYVCRPGTESYLKQDFEHPSATSERNRIVHLLREAGMDAAADHVARAAPCGSLDSEAPTLYNVPTEG